MLDISFFGNPIDFLYKIAFVYMGMLIWLFLQGTDIYWGYSIFLLIEECLDFLDINQPIDLFDSKLGESISWWLVCASLL